MNGQTLQYVVRARSFSGLLSAHGSCSSFLFFSSIQRGWATWTTGIVDTRVTGMIPIVEDLLNLSKV